MAPKAPSQPYSLVRDSLRQAVSTRFCKMQLPNAIRPLCSKKKCSQQQNRVPVIHEIAWMAFEIAI